MTQKTRWVCLAAGVVILVVGLVKLFRDGDGIPAILGLLIVAFSASGILKEKGGKKP
ncbi:MAG: hypothetical protein GX443_00055 [Deltaproteobacteria bacterium]|nr:hypothetical protein [Deltaproteobacteria bacterium]